MPSVFKLRLSLYFVAMNVSESDFGHLDSIDAEAVGQPGNRRFRLVAVSRGQAASVWMEKVQLASIGESFDEIAKRLDAESPSSDPDQRPAPTPLNFDLDFRAAQLALGYLEDEELFTIHAFGAEEGLVSSEPTFRCQISRGQVRVLSSNIATVVAAGRQLCPLCQRPVDPAGHVCPRSNGHQAGVTV